MKGLSLACALSAALVGVSFGGPVQAQERFVTIGTGGQTGVYYVAGQSICRFLNRGAAVTRSSATPRPVAAVLPTSTASRSGEFNFGIMQSDHQYKAMKGVEPFKAEGPMDDIRAVFSPAERSVHHPGSQGRQGSQLRRLEGQSASTSATRVPVSVTPLKRS